MAALLINLLGPFQVIVGGEPAEGFDSNKVRALLAYLVAEAERPHAREAVAGLLWPDYPQRSALNNLRSALANLREVIGDREAQPPFLLISRDTLQFNRRSAHTVDVAALVGVPERSSQQMEQAVAVYRGRFLEGFSLADSAPFEEWLLYKREQTERRMLDTLQQLSAYYEGCGDYRRAMGCARRALDLEPWREEAQRQLMRALAFSGQRSGALIQYENFRRLLAEQLDIAPAEETKALAESIRDGTLRPVSSVRAEEADRTESEPPAPGEAPFKGLSYFEEADAGRFFGREALTAQLVALVEKCLDPELRGERFLAVIGASGSGKSSVVRAGLVPALKHRREDGDTHFSGRLSRASFPGPIVILTPTARPLEALALSLASADGPVAETAALLDSLTQDPRSLHLAASQMNLRNGGAERLLLIVDQFEELFALCRDGAERHAFVENLLTAAAAPGPVIVILVMRADFYAHCAPYASLRQALSARQQYIGAMCAQEARRAIVEPARLGGWVFEPGLVDLILRDVGDDAGALPLLSHALLSTWQRRRGRTLTLTGYQETGGVQKAITQTAETVYRQLTPQQQAIARSIFLRLTELGEGAADETQPALFTRRRAELAELIPNEQEAGPVQAVLLKLADARLITTSQETAEVTHEALIQEWARLREWLDESREALRMQRQLMIAAREWERLDRDSDALYRGARLVQVAEWARENPGDLSRLEQIFIEASMAEEQAQQAAEVARRQRELEAAQNLAEEQRRRAEAEGQRAEEQAESAGKLWRRAVWLALAAGALLLLLLLAVGLGKLANSNALAAQEQTRLAISRELAAASGNNLLADPERSVLLALQALETADTLEARNALHQALPELRVLRTIPVIVGGVPGVAFSPDGKRLAGIGIDGEVQIWDAATGDLVLALPPDSGEIGYDVTFSPDGSRLAATWANQVMLWDAAAGERLFALPGETAGTVRRLDFSPDGQRLAVASMDGLPRVWDLARQEELLSLAGHHDICEAIAYSPDGKRLATGDIIGFVKIWDASTGQELLSFEHGGGVHSVAYSPDGTQLAVASDNGRLGIWDAASGEQLHDIPVRSGVYDVDYMPDGRRLVATHQDGTTTIWEPLSGQQQLLLAGHVSTVISAAPSPDNNLLATSGYDGTLKLWDLNPGRELLTIAAHDQPVYDIAYTPDGSRLVTAGFDGRASLWDAATGLLVRSLPPEEAAPFSSLDMSRDGRRLAFGGWDGSLTVTDMDSDQIALALPAHAAVIIDLAFSPDGRRLATASWDGTAKVWDLSSGEPLTTFTSTDDQVVSTAINGVAFSPDGQYLFTGGDDDTIHQWDAVTGEERQRFSSDGLDIYGVAVSPDGKVLAMGRQDGVVILWDVATGEKLHQLAAHAGLVVRLAFSADGTELASVGFDSLVKVWDVETGQELMTLYGITGNVFGAAFSPDGQQLAAAGGDGTVRLYTLDLAELIALAQGRVTRGLTAEECRSYLHTETCPSTG